ncbi:MAG TPA: nitroreductase family protein [Rectinemataceae bacterium]|nr:nitroreductase family protein [Rectinemataceae bacterium]
MEAGSGLSEAERALLDASARSYLGALERRYACKRFSAARAIPGYLVRYILECGRLAPTSFGLEHWLFVAGSTSTLGPAFVKACGGQECVASADLAVVFAVRAAEDYAPGSAFLRQRAERFPGGLKAFLPDYLPYYEELASTGRVEEWARSQCYLASMAMMGAAAAAEIDSCPIEGFGERALLESVGLGTDTWRAALVTVFGYAAELRRERIREDFAATVDLR